MALGNGVRPVGSDLDDHPVPDFRHEAALRLAKAAIGDVGAVRSRCQTISHPQSCLLPGPFNSKHYRSSPDDRLSGDDPRSPGDCGANRGSAPFSGRLAAPLAPELERSEEHTSELQSLMRISYAVFCLKKNKPHTNV